MKFSKKILAAFLAALMAISMMPFTVFAAPPGSSESGTGASGGISIGGGSTVVGGDSYLTFTGTDSFSIKTKNNMMNWNGTLEYSTDTNTWTTWNGTSQISSVNNVLYLRGTGNTQITGSGGNSTRWVITTQGTVACSGDIRMLLNYANPASSSMGAYCFAYLFYNCTSLTAAPELPATTLANYCYYFMFYGCTSLKTAPELPATTLMYACYSNMFKGCTSLTTAPELPATTLATYCYYNMFYGCRSLTTAPDLPATTLAQSCYSDMFHGCTGIKLSTEQTAEYSVPYSIPKEGTGSMGTNALSNMFTGTGGTFTGTPTINTTYYIPAPAPTEPNNGSSITVAETISENFYLDDEFYGEDSFITVNYNHNSNVSETDDFRTDVVAMNSLPELDDSTSEYNGARKFSVVQAPAQATEPIEIKVYANAADAAAGTNAIDTINYSVYSYCRQIITGDYAENLKDLAKSTLDYAAAAQDYFDYNTENMATKDATGGFYNEVANADLSNVAGVSAAPSCITKASVVVKSDLEINLFSLTPIEVTGASMDATKGKDRFAATSYQSGDYYVVHIAGIEPANMDNTITVNTSEGDIVMTANAIIKMMLSSNDAKLVTLAKAMYLYGAAANAYFD